MLHFVQAHGLHIFSWVIDQTVAPLHGINRLSRSMRPIRNCRKIQGDLAWEVGFTDCYVLASKGFTEKISLSSKAKITSLLDLAQLTISAIVPVRYPGGKRSFTLDVNACGYGRFKRYAGARCCKMCGSLKFYLSIRSIQERISVQTLVGKRTVKALPVSLGSADDEGGHAGVRMPNSISHTSKAV